LHLNIIFQITNLLRLKLEFRIDFILGFFLQDKITTRDTNLPLKK
jgi:hypothetical protein